MKEHSNSTISQPCPAAGENLNGSSPSPQTGSPTTLRNSTSCTSAATSFSQPSSLASPFNTLDSSFMEAKFRAPPHNQFHDAGEPWKSACKSRLPFPAHSHNPPRHDQAGPGEIRFMLIRLFFRFALSTISSYISLIKSLALNHPPQ